MLGDEIMPLSNVENFEENNDGVEKRGKIERVAAGKTGAKRIWVSTNYSQLTANPYNTLLKCWKEQRDDLNWGLNSSIHPKHIIYVNFICFWHSLETSKVCLPSWVLSNFFPPNKNQPLELYDSKRKSNHSPL